MIDRPAFVFSNGGALEMTMTDLTRIFAGILSVGLLATSAAAADPGFDSRGHQFVWFDAFDAFAKALEGKPRVTVLISPVIASRIAFNHLIVSWNAALPKNASLKVEAKALYGDASTVYYKLGLWSLDPTRHPRQSVANQADADGTVATDVLVLQQPAKAFQLRLTFEEAEPQTTLKFLAVSLADTNSSPPPDLPVQSAWGKLLEVPERSQMLYPNGKTLCSPTTVSMILGFWAQTLHRPELDHAVPEIVEAIYDSQYQGTGNWPFNMAYAGSLPGMRAYVTRLSYLAELEAWIARGLPVGMSVDYDVLRAKGPGPNGHLVVLVGFNKQGDPIINDPGTSAHVRKVFSRQNLLNAWSCSGHTVYLIYPEKYYLPSDDYGHWESARTRFGFP